MMKKIASSLLVVSTQLIVGGLFLVMLFSDSPEDNKVVVVKNNNLNKMADSVSELFVADQLENALKADETEIKLMNEQEAAKKKAEEEAKKKAEEEARAKAEAEAKAKAEAEAKAKAEAEVRERARQEAAAANVSNDVASLQSYAHNLVLSYGWTEADFTALVSLWNRESGWNVHAGNSSGAYGIPQALPGSKMAAFGSDWANNGQTQIKWGLSYIKSTYGSPSAAWSAFCTKGWY